MGNQTSSLPNMSAPANSDLAFTTHALLLGFKDTQLAKDLEHLGDVMRTELGWKASVYWIDDESATSAESKLLNMAFSLRSKIRHPDERVVV